MSKDFFKNAVTLAVEPQKNAPPEHPKLKAAIARYAETGSPEDKAAIHRAIGEGKLLFVHRPAANFAAGDIEVRITTGPDGSRAMEAFTDFDEIIARVGRGDFDVSQMPGVDFLAWVLEDAYGGIVINPAGPYAWVSAEEMRHIQKRDFAKKPPAELEFNLKEKPVPKSKAKKSAPALPPKIQSAFDNILRTTPSISLSDLTREFQEAMKTHSAANEHLGIDTKLLKELAIRSQYLLEQYPKLGKDDQVLALSAVRYFVSNEDAVSDTAALGGLDDDVMVMNYVLERLGFAERRITTYDN